MAGTAADRYASEPLATGENLEAFTKGRIKKTDQWVGEALSAASQAVRNVCGWHVGPEVTETLIVSGRGARVLTLPTLHVTAITAVTVDAVALTPDVDFEWDESGVLERYAGWVSKRRGVAVSLTHGWPLAAIPEVVDLVCSLAARAVIAARAGGVVREQAGTNSLELAKVGGALLDATVLDHERAKLRPYILPARS